MKKLIIFITTLIFLINILMLFKPTYSGTLSNITGTPGNLVLTFYDSDTNETISYDDAIKYYGITHYYQTTYNSNLVFFYNGKEISKSEYLKGYYDEEATNRKNNLGSIAYRVKTTSEVKTVVDKLYDNYKIGTYYLEYSPYDNIDWDNVNTYLHKKYELESVKQNYYTYQLIGINTPLRFNTTLNETNNKYEYSIDTTGFRLTKDQKQVTDNFINNLLTLLQGDGSDYEKILAAYTYITKTTTYLPDTDYVTDMLKSNTSIYSVFINRKSVCIGYSIGFSYLMDKLGINSYIVDQVSYVNEETKTYVSTHTYNIVELDNKWYKIDTTGGIFLGSISANELYNTALNISNTRYDTNNKKTTYDIDYNKVNTYLNNAKNLKTTTTKYLKTTTTSPTLKIKTSTSKKTSKVKTTTTKLTSKNSKTTESTTITTNEYITYDYKKTTTTTTININNDPKTEDNSDNSLNNIKLILILIGIITIIILIIYEIFFKNTNSNKIKQ